MKRIRKTIYTCAAALLAACLIHTCFALSPYAAEENGISYDQVEEADEQTEAVSVGKYGMLPIYGRDVKDGTYSIAVESSSPMFRIVQAELTVAEGEMTAVITLSGKGYLKLFVGTGSEAAAAGLSDYIDYVENEDGMYTYTIPVEALDKELNCAAFSERKEKWYDRVILFDASSLPEDALLVELPDYDMIEAALNSFQESTLSDEDTARTEKETAASDSTASTDESISSGSQTPEPAEPVSVSLEDGEYSISVDLMGGSGKSSILSPTLLTIRDGKAYVAIEWSSSSYDYMIVGNEKYLNTAEEEANSTFEIPISAMDSEMSVIADTTAMGTPHEIEYTLIFYSDTIGPKSQMPREAAKQVVAVAFVIIIGGGILNHFINKKKKC